MSQKINQFSFAQTHNIGILIYIFLKNLISIYERRSTSRRKNKMNKNE